MAAASLPAAIAARLGQRRPSTARWPSRLRPAAFSTTSEPLQPQCKQLVLYTKPGCCLCDGLKDKLRVALSLDGDHSLRSVQLQMRDITENPEWERLYQYEIPVLAKLLPDGTEVALPRFSPRMGAEIIQKKIAAALNDG